ncbi:NAD(P)H-dependent glycerol-3-phosphate dehydrogenase [Paracidovorax avenae]|uniref:NAD(P)H-dependent glycerol-3-phosphate dehydrogenase n=1 Tax=Paracidovorax avenae TaxID=80867 RepID=UPI0006B37C55|nr:NAD(P)H-dependent glycerol-3-phosphate dehydrogenase [Paracidovorax avenae]
MKIIVFGAGAWGTAMALSAAAHPAGHAVTLWARDGRQAAAMQAARENARYLPGIAFPPAFVLASGAPSGALASSRADLAIVATPMSGLRGMLEALRDAAIPVAWLCKGFEAVPAGGEAASQGMMAHEICSQVAPRLRAGALSGPSFALEAAQGRPTALVAASRDAQVRELLVEAFHGPTLRVYANEDIVGVEVGGAVKNVLAIATGLCDGLDLGTNARAALITRGLAEMSRLGLALGARAETFMGLSGLGDLVLTATGDLSRNRRVGLALARGLTLDQAVESLGHVAEGVYSARTVVRRAGQLGVDMPIAQEVVALLDGRSTASEAVARLMGRGPAAELRSC